MRRPGLQVRTAEPRRSRSLTAANRRRGYGVLVRPAEPIANDLRLITHRKLDAQTGDVVWNADHGNNVLAITVDSAGNVYTGDAKGVVKKWDADGSLVWTIDLVATFDNPPEFDAKPVNDLDVDGDDRLLIGAADPGIFSGRGGRLLKVNSEGLLIWDAQTSLGANLATDFVFHLGSGDVVAGGNSKGNFATGWRVSGTDGSLLAYAHVIWDSLAEALPFGGALFDFRRKPGTDLVAFAMSSVDGEFDTNFLGYFSPAEGGAVRVEMRHCLAICRSTPSFPWDLPWFAVPFNSRGLFPAVHACDFSGSDVIAAVEGLDTFAAEEDPVKPSLYAYADPETELAVGDQVWSSSLPDTVPVIVRVNSAGAIHVVPRAGGVSNREPGSVLQKLNSDATEEIWRFDHRDAIRDLVTPAGSFVYLGGDRVQES